MRIGTKTDLKTESFGFFECSRFVTTEKWSSRRTAFALPIRVSIPLFWLSSLMSTTPRYLNVSTCCSVLPLTCRNNCLGCLKRHNTSIFLVLFLFLLGRTQHKTDQMRAENPVEKIHACNTDSSAKSKRFILQSPTVTLLLTRLWLSIHFRYTRALQIFWERPHKLLHNSSRAEHPA